MSGTLYDLTSDLLALGNMLTSGEIDEQTYADTLASLEFDTEAKLEGYAMLIRNLDAHADAIRNEESRLRAKRVAAENAMERLKDRIKHHLVATGQTKAKAGLFSWSLRTSRAVAVVDESLIPAELFRVKTEPDKTAIREWIDAGGTVPGAVIEERTSVVLK